MQFELMHLSLLERERDLFDPKIAISREAWLREAFGEKITFTHYREQFHYVPEPDTTLDFGPLIAGRIGRRVSVSENDPPEKGLHETHREAWMAADVFIDPTHHAEGQKAAVQYREDVGKAFSILESLAKHINAETDPRHPYVIEIARISDPQSFWDWANSNKGAVTSVEFELVTPNMFDGPENMAEEMKAMRDQERARRIRFEFENPDSLELDTSRVKTMVDYATKGGGNIKARTKTKKNFDSKKKAKVIAIPETDAAGAKSSIAAVLQAVKVLIFGK